MQVDGCHLKYARLEDLPESCALEPTEWLGERELSEFSRLKNEQRQHAWLAGRWLAKQLVLATISGRLQPETRFLEETGFLDTPVVHFALDRGALVKTPAPATRTPTHTLRTISISTHNESGKANRPQVIIDGCRWDRSLSISHSDRGVLVAVSESNDIEIGIDLTEQKQATPGFLTTWFTPHECETLDDLPASEAMVFWAIKEAVYKACQQGESFKPRKFEVSRCQQARYECHDEERTETARDITVGSIDGQIAVVAVMQREPYKTPLAV